MRKLGRKVTIVLLALMMLVSTTQQFSILGENKASAAGLPDFAGGSGSSSDPYQIETAYQLNAVRNYPNSSDHFKLTKDIDLISYGSGEGWTPIGSWDVNGFRGTFNGNGKTIRNLNINRPTVDFQALFGLTERTATISDVNLIDVKVIGKNNSASLVAQNQGTVDKVSVSGEVTGFNSIGGLVGVSSSGKIINSSANVKVEGTDNIGGLIGDANNQEKVDNNYAVGNVTGKLSVGGLIGVGIVNTSINNNYAVGNVSGEMYIGGLIGYSGNNTSLDKNYATGNVKGSAVQVGGLIGYSSDEVVSNSFALGNVTGVNLVGGLIGFNSNTTFSNNYATGKVTGNPHTGGLIGYGSNVSNGFYNKETTGQSDTGKGNPVSTAEMRLQATYTNWTFDTSTWTIDPAHNNGFPYLSKLPSPEYVVYSANGDTGGAVPISKLLRQGQKVIVDDNSGNLTKSGYTFVGWNTKADGSGDAYEPGDLYNISIGADITLYAEWLPNPPVLTADTTDNDIISDIEITFADDSTWRDEITAIFANGVTLREENYSKKAGKITLFANVLAANTYTIIVVADGYVDATVQQIIHPNRNLSSLVLSSGVMNETFTSDKTSYTQSVQYGVTSLKVTPTVVEPTAIVKVAVNGEASEIVTSGDASAALPLKVGANTITVAVTVGNGPSKVYTVVVTRNAASTNSGGSIPIIDTNVTSSNGTITIPTGSTGKVTLDNEVTVDIPVNATNKDVTITIEKLLELNNLLANGEILASHVFEILKNFPGNFSKPVTLTFVFDPTKVGSDQRPAVFYYDEVKKVWVEVTGGKINGNRISVEVDHFTKYAVFVVDSATSKPETDTEVKFSDIAGHWAQASIKQAVSGGIVKGYTDGTFKPNATVTRAEFAVMLINALKPQGNGADLTFTDNAKIGTWAQKAVAQAVQANIIKGNQDGSFRPNAEVTRAEMAVMIANALGQSVEANATTSFADDKDIPAWAKGSVAYVKQAGIVQGKSGNLFAPQDHATRAEAVTVLLKMLAQKNK
ncbi:putative repeat protein (TIGR02543 family) [Paenibacillus baekrokdamisoli]|nr:S-layer homology domain-containing protein [Paenibacillus baekrokdamisoli]MBB3069227.1 putative repeat protein (TIGR02543 family) [Paenibacillus baekrokdamisoli]